MKTIWGVATAIAVGCVAVNFTGAAMLWLRNGSADWWAATSNSAMQVAVVVVVAMICAMIARNSGKDSERS